MNRKGEWTPRLRWLPLVVLALGLLSTAGATYTLADVSKSRSTLRFATIVAETQASIEGRIDAQVSLLRGVAGLIAADPDLDRDDFARYVERLSLERHYPGVQGVGFAARVRPEARAAFEARARARGVEGFRIWPEGPRDEYHCILFLEPLDRRNLAAIGYDMATEPTRREAMERARDSGEAALSGPVVLVQELGAQQQTGFLIYLPIYEGGDVPASEAARRELLIGFAYSPFRADDLFNGIFSSEAQQRLAFDIFDGAAPRPEALLHRSPQAGGPLYVPAHREVRTIAVAGRPWTIVYSSEPAFDATGDAYVAPLAFSAGIVLSLVLFFLVRAQTLARHEAELAVRARDSFLSVAAHELKTPLTALHGNAQLLARRLSRSARLSEGEQRNVEAIIEASRRLNRLVDELLDHTRLTEGQLTLAQQPLDLAELTRRVTNEVGPNLARHRLRLCGSAPLPIIGDPMRLEQVLLNLLGNAAKYSPGGGPIDLALERDEPWAVLRVRDHGIGIPTSALPQLFQQFYRAPNAIAQHIPGIGIGLHLVKELIERHGGTISVESVEGEGSTFVVRLPLADVAPAISSPAHQSDSQAQPTQL